MHNRGQYHIGIVLIIIGLLFLIGRMLDVNVWSVIWPLGLIGLGAWLLLRQKHVGSETSVSQRFLGDIHREGAWHVTDEEIRIFIGDVDLDMAQADISTGETNIRIFGFIGDVDILVPKSVGVSISSTGFITDAKVLGQKEEKFLTPLRITSNGYEKAKTKIRLETTFFIGDLTVKQV